MRGAFETSSHTIGQHALSSTVSVGVAISDEEYSDLSALLSAADRALYRAKAEGRNCVRLAKPAVPSDLSLKQIR